MWVTRCICSIILLTDFSRSPGDPVISSLSLQILFTDCSVIFRSQVSEHPISPDYSLLRVDWMRNNDSDTRLCSRLSRGDRVYLLPDMCTILICYPSCPASGCIIHECVSFSILDVTVILIPINICELIYHCLYPITLLGLCCRAHLLISAVLKMQGLSP